MKGKENLIPFNKLSPEERKEIARRGGIASGEAKARRRALREELEILLEKDSNQVNISLALIKEALKGNTKAFEVIRDTIGEKPKEVIEADVNNEVSINIELSDE